MSADEAKADETRLQRAGNYSWRLVLTTVATLPGAIVPGLVGAGPVATLIGTIVAGLVGAFFIAERPTTRTKAMVGLLFTATAVALTVSGFTLADFLRGRSVVGDTRYTFPVSAGAADKVDEPQPQPSLAGSPPASAPGAAPSPSSAPGRTIPKAAPTRTVAPGPATATDPGRSQPPASTPGPSPSSGQSPATAPTPGPVPANVYSYGLEIDGIPVNHLRLVGTISVGSGPGSVTLAKAVSGDTAFEDLMRSPQRRNMVLTNFDAEGNPIRRYRIEGALPTSLESSASEESLTFAYESASIE